MDRESIIQEVARTLFVNAYADGVEAGTVLGPRAGAGEDWMDVAPREWRYRLTVTGEPGSVESADERAQIAAAYAAAERLRARGYNMGAMRVDRAFARTGLALAQGFRGPPVSGGNVAEARLVRVEGSESTSLAEARRIVDAFDEHGALIGFLSEAQGNPLLAAPREGAPIEQAARIHAELSGTDRFAHCLAVTALGSGVGLEDDLPSGAHLPGWIRASVVSSDYGEHSLERRDWRSESEKEEESD